MILRQYFLFPTAAFHRVFCLYQCGSCLCFVKTGIRFHNRPRCKAGLSGIGFFPSLFCFQWYLPNNIQCTWEWQSRKSTVTVTKHKAVKMKHKNIITWTFWSSLFEALSLSFSLEKFKLKWHLFHSPWVLGISEFVAWYMIGELTHFPFYCNKWLVFPWGECTGLNLFLCLNIHFTSPSSGIHYVITVWLSHNMPVIYEKQQKMWEKFPCFASDSYHWKDRTSHSEQKPKAET